MTAAKIVTVWLDQTSDEAGWIVSTDVAGGGESETVRTFPPTMAGEKAARKFAAEYAERQGIEVA